jgi:hypothetical protein
MIGPVIVLMIPDTPVYLVSETRTTISSKILRLTDHSAMVSSDPFDREYCWLQCEWYAGGGAGQGGWR